jgi:hypothetical protein
VLYEDCCLCVCFSAAEAHMSCVSNIVGKECGDDAMKLIGDIAKREMGMSTQFMNNLNITVRYGFQ